MNAAIGKFIKIIPGIIFICLGIILSIYISITSRRGAEENPFYHGLAGLYG